MQKTTKEIVVMFVLVVGAVITGLFLSQRVGVVSSLVYGVKA